MMRRAMIGGDGADNLAVQIKGGVVARPSDNVDATFTEALIMTFAKARCARSTAMSPAGAGLPSGQMKTWANAVGVGALRSGSCGAIRSLIGTQHSIPGSSNVWQVEMNSLRRTVNG